MLNRKIIPFSAFSFFILLWIGPGCKHAHEELLPIDLIPVATINFISPLPGAVYSNGDSVNISATAVSTEDIHGYEISIKKLNDTVVYYTEFIHDHNDTLLINKKWSNTLSIATQLEAIISLLVDHQGHTYKKSVIFRTQ